MITVNLLHGGFYNGLPNIKREMEEFMVLDIVKSECPLDENGRKHGLWILWKTHSSEDKTKHNRFVERIEEFDHGRIINDYSFNKKGALLSTRGLEMNVGFWNPDTFSFIKAGKGSNHCGFFSNVHLKKGPSKEKLMNRFLPQEIKDIQEEIKRRMNG
jgi:hypothetical protein